MEPSEAFELVCDRGISNLYLEELISKDFYFAYHYANCILKGRFELGEEAISKSCIYAYGYARDIIKGRWELGEKAISKDCYQSYCYAAFVLQGRFKLGEKVISENKSLIYHCTILKWNHE